MDWVGSGGGDDKWEVMKKFCILKVETMEFFDRLNEGMRKKLRFKVECEVMSLRTQKRGVTINLIENTVREPLLQERSGVQFKVCLVVVAIRQSNGKS